MSIKESEIVRLTETIIEHPSFKAANDALVLQSIRAGNSGYTGEEFIQTPIRKALDLMYELGRIELMAEIQKVLHEERRWGNRDIDILRHHLHLRPLNEEEMKLYKNSFEAV